MTDLVFKVLLKADGSGLIGQTKLSREEVDKLTAANVKVASSADQVTVATGKAGQAEGARAKDQGGKDRA